MTAPFTLQRRAFLGSLKGANMAALSACLFGKLVLRERLLQAQSLQHFAKNRRR